MRTPRVLGLTAATVAASVLLSPHAWAEGTLDQQFSGTLPVVSNAPITPTLWYGTAVTPQLSGLLDQVDLYLRQSGSSTQDLTMTIYGTAAGRPSGPALASVSLPASTIASTFDWVPFTFGSPARVNAGGQFAVVLTTPDPEFQAYLWAGTDGVVSSPYSGGFASYNTGSGWTANSAYSQWFRTYVTPVAEEPAAPSQTPPPVLQQFEFVSDQSRTLTTCDAQASSALNWGGAGGGGWGSSWAQWANGGEGGPVCTRTLVYNDSLGRWEIA